MTSKEALDNITIYSALHNGILDNNLKVIYKDLDVLEIVKEKLMWVENNKIYIGLQNDTYIELTEEDFNYDDRYIILKEWLDEKDN